MTSPPTNLPTNGAWRLSCSPTRRARIRSCRWALGVYHGLRMEHLQAYLDEFVFRFNRRRSPQAAFARLLGLATATGPHPYEAIIAMGSKG